MVFGVAAVGEHQGMGIDHAGKRRMERARAAQRRLQPRRRGTVQQFQFLNAPSPAGLDQPGQDGEPGLVRRRHQFAEAPAWNAAALAIAVGALGAGPAQARAQRARRIQETGVDDLVVARAGLVADPGVAFDDDDLAPGPRQRPGDRKADDAGAGNDALDGFGHGGLPGRSGRIRSIPAARPVCRAIIGKPVRS